MKQIKLMYNINIMIRYDDPCRLYYFCCVSIFYRHKFIFYIVKLLVENDSVITGFAEPQ